MTKTPIVKVHTSPDPIEDGFLGDVQADRPEPYQSTVTKPMFDLGRVLYTPGVAAMQERGLSVLKLIKRHMVADFGDLDEDDQAMSDLALMTGCRVLSSYDTDHGTVFIITEADRSSTTVMCDWEY